MFLALNIIIAATCFLTGGTWQTYASLHAFSLFVTIPMLLTVFLTSDDGNMVVDSLLTVGVSLLMIFLIL